MSDYEFSDDDNEYYDEDEEMIDPEDGMSATLRLLCARWGHQPSQLRNTHTLAAALSAAQPSSSVDPARITPSRMHNI